MPRPIPWCRKRWAEAVAGSVSGGRVEMAAIAMMDLRNMWSGSCLWKARVAILGLSVDRDARHVQDRAAKSCFVNDMVKKHLPVTKLVARNANKSARAVQLPFISWLSAACGCGCCRAGCAAFGRQS